MPLIDRYREIELVAAEMLAAGRAGDWQRVGDLGSSIRSLADDIARAGGANALDAGQRRERMRILGRLVVVDGELRRLRDPACAWLDAMFDVPRDGDGTRRRGDGTPRRGDGTPRRGDGTPRRANGTRRRAGDAPT